jgi:hypothetical protein
MRGLMVACALGIVAASVPVHAASEEDCRKFHDECESARALGHRDVGICRVEETECAPRSGDAAASGAGKGVPLPAMPRPPALPGADRKRGVGP